MQQLDTICEKLGLDKAENFKPLRQLAQKLNVKASYIAFGIILLVLLFVVIGFGASLLSGMVGFIYPSYMSFKTLKNEDLEANKHWLTYWTVYSFITLFDPVLEIILSFLPMYHLLKLFFFVWLFNPKTQGAQIIYEKMLKPFLIKYESKIDSNLKKAENKIRDAQNETQPLIEQAKETAETFKQD